MPRAIWNGVVIAESGKTEVVEGNHYFPAEALSREHFRESATTRVCPWTGMAKYYTVTVGDRENVNAAWYYPNPKPAATTAFVVVRSVTKKGYQPSTSAAARRKLRCLATLRNAFTPSGPPCLTVKSCFIPRQHCRE